jgi:starch synthase (maltosyl-transferring)
MRGSDESVSPRIYYTDPVAEAPAGAVRAAAALGFSHVMVPPPWRFPPHGDRFVSASLSEIDPSLPPDAALPALAGLARDAGLGLLLDVAIDRVAAGADLASAAVFTRPDAGVQMDPRQNAESGVAKARLDTDADARATGAWWGAHLRTWRAAGAAGFRVLGLAACPAAHVHAFLSALREGAGDGLLLVWTPGMSTAQVAAMRGAGIDGVFGSLPWWDFQASWFWDEVARLRSVAPLIGAAAAPFGPAENVGRGGGLAAVLGSGWMEVAGAGMATGLVRHVNGLLAGNALQGLAGLTVPLTGAGNGILVLMRTDAPDIRRAGRAALLLLNTDPGKALPVSPAMFLAATGGCFGRFASVLPADGSHLAPDSKLMLAAGEMRVYVAEVDRFVAETSPPSAAGAIAAACAPRLGIEAVTPAVDGGAYPVKRTAGETVQVRADILFDGHEKIAAVLRWRGPGAGAWREAPMRDLGNDRWQGAFPLEGLGRHEYVVLAWRDRFGSFRDELAKKHAAGVDIAVETMEGEALVTAARGRSAGALGVSLRQACVALAAAGTDARRDILLSDDLLALMTQADDRPFAVESAPMPVEAERIGARFASWYELFPRSLSDVPGQHGTFADVIRHLPRIRDMGFDVLYFPPIHPIGRVNRKGPNNSLTPGPDDPGSPYAIGSEEGGHDALHPELGSFEDFQALRREAAVHGLELAMDFAVQCAPDHPWLKAHKGWFDWRPDGSIKYAENPPKKYQDIVNVDFYAKDAIPGLWLELLRIVLFWAEQGVRLFRVDNPHTKPFPFWEWMIGQVRARHPDAVFLAEAFTRPKIMYRLAKIGFSQSYTYFTWRNSKRELQAYFAELADTAPRDFFRPHLFVNTPDINPPFLQTSGRPGHLIRAALAATLSGLWGVYNGFELCDATPLPGREEYLDSEKYQLRTWDWARPGNIISEISLLNRIRRLNPALQTHLGVTFLNAWNDAILYYEKATEDRSNVVLVAVSLDPEQPQGCDFEVPLWSWGLPDSAAIAAEDLVSGDTTTWFGKVQHMYLTPEKPYMIWRVRPV